MNFKTTLALAALAIASSHASAAVVHTFDFTSSSVTTKHYTETVQGTDAGTSFSDTINLLLPNSTTSSSNVLSTTFNWSTPSGFTNITNGSVTLYDADTNTVVGTPYTFTPTSGTETFKGLEGNYYFVVAGTLAPDVSGSYEIDAKVSAGLPPASAVPEPASSALLLAGVGLMGFMGLRRKQK